MEFSEEERRQQQLDARMDALKEKIRASMTSTGGQIRDDDPRPDDEGTRIREGIARRQAIERVDREMAAEEAAQRERERLLEEKERLADEALERELAEDESYLEDQEQIIATFNQEFPDLAERLETDMVLREKMNVALDLEIAGSGKGNLYYPSYRRAAVKFIDRLEKVNDDWDLYEKMYQREDQLAKIEHGNLQERERDNRYFNSTLRDDRPASQEEVINQVNIDHPEVMQDPTMYKEAVMSVDRQVNQGADHNRYSTYDQAARDAHTKNALREMQESRGKSPDTI